MIEYNVYDKFGQAIKVTYKPRKVVVRFDPLEGLTEQSHKDSCDINKIMAFYQKSGRLPEGLSTGQPIYGDFSELFDYGEAMNIVSEAQERFSELPAELRRHFNEDPANLLAAIQDESRFDELVDLGILVRNEPANDAGDVKPEPQAS
ncbi:MAG: internal scaffolding protein [Microviridae sp.]|nr:MAG: internal scaffolding protein [Microviridae sp.]